MRTHAQACIHISVSKSHVRKILIKKNIIELILHHLGKSLPLLSEHYKKAPWPFSQNTPNLLQKKKKKRFKKLIEGSGSNQRSKSSFVWHKCSTLALWFPSFLYLFYCFNNFLCSLGLSLFNYEHAKCRIDVIFVCCLLRIYG